MCHYISFSKTCTNILFSPNQIHCLLEWFSPCLSWKTRLLFLHREWLWRDSGYHGLVFSIIWGKRWCDCVCVMGVMYRPGELLCSPGYVSRCYACRKAWVCSEESFLSPLLFSISHCIHEYINCEYINFSSIFNGVLVCVIYSLCCNGVCVCVCLSWFCLLPVWLVVRTGLRRVPPLCEIDIRWSWWLEQYHIQSSFSKGQSTPETTLWPPHTEHHPQLSTLPF